MGRGVGLAVGLGVGEGVTWKARLAMASLPPIGKAPLSTAAVETSSSPAVASPGTGPLTVAEQLPPAPPIATVDIPIGSLESGFTQVRTTVSPDATPAAAQSATSQL